MTQTISIKDARNNLADLVNQVSIAGNSYIITKFGKPKAIITAAPIQAESIEDVLRLTSGMWKHRKDIKGTAKFVAKLRHKMSSRFPIAK